MRFEGRVKQHMGRGTRLGFPTANLDKIPPIDTGVYLAVAGVAGKKMPALAFKGTAQTFNEDTEMFEIYILDFKQDIYGEQMSVELFDKIRGVIKFEHREELVEQMKKDEAVAREFFKQYNTGS